jgi:hypothetical protein
MFYPPIAMNSTIRLTLIVLPALAGVLFCVPTVPAQSAAATKPSVAEALAFIDRAEQELNTLQIDQARASWVEETYITDDTVALLAKASDRLIARQTELIGQARRFEGLPLPPEAARKLLLLKLSVGSGIGVAAPRTPSCAPRLPKRPRNSMPRTAAANGVRMLIRSTAWALTRSASKWPTAAIPRNSRPCG